MPFRLAGCGVAPRTHGERLDAARGFEEAHRAMLRADAAASRERRANELKKRPPTGAELSALEHLRRTEGFSATCTRFGLGRNTLVRLLKGGEVRATVLDRMAPALLAAA